MGFTKYYRLAYPSSLGEGGDVTVFGALSAGATAPLFLLPWSSLGNGSAGMPRPAAGASCLNMSLAAAASVITVRAPGEGAILLEPQSSLPFVNRTPHSHALPLPTLPLSPYVYLYPFPDPGDGAALDPCYCASCSYVMSVSCPTPPAGGGGGAAVDCAFRLQATVASPSGPVIR